MKQPNLFGEQLLARLRSKPEGFILTITNDPTTGEGPPLSFQAAHNLARRLDRVPGLEAFQRKRRNGIYAVLVRRDPNPVLSDEQLELPL